MTEVYKIITGKYDEAVAPRLERDDKLQGAMNSG